VSRYSIRCASARRLTTRTSGRRRSGRGHPARDHHPARSIAAVLKPLPSIADGHAQEGKRADPLLEPAPGLFCTAGTQHSHTKVPWTRRGSHMTPGSGSNPGTTLDPGASTEPVRATAPPNDSVERTMSVPIEYRSGVGSAKSSLSAPCSGDRTGEHRRSRGLRCGGVGPQNRSEAERTGESAAARQPVPARTMALSFSHRFAFTSGGGAWPPFSCAPAIP
jgi:hypothetical protein